MKLCTSKKNSLHKETLMQQQQKIATKNNNNNMFISKPLLRNTHAEEHLQIKQN